MCHDSVIWLTLVNWQQYLVSTYTNWRCFDQTYRKSRRKVVAVLNSQAYGGMEAHLHGFLTQERHSKSICFTFRPLYPRVKSRGTRWVQGGMGPKAHLHAVVKIKRRPLPGNETRFLVNQLDYPGSRLEPGEKVMLCSFTIYPLLKMLLGR